MIIGKNLGRQTEAVRQSIVRYIWTKNLQAGDRLPPQTELCRMLQVGSATVTRAVQALVQENVLESRQRAGIFVKTPQPPGHLALALGVIGQMQEHAASFNWLCSKSIQAFMRKNGCICMEFPFSGKRMTGAEMEDFPGLDSTIQQRQLQGIITLHNLSEAMIHQLEEQKIPVCFLGSSTNAISGVVLDWLPMITEGLEELIHSGKKHPAIVIGPLFPELRKEIINLLGKFTDSPTDYLFEDKNPIGNIHLHGGCKLAQQLLTYPESKRPDGLMICDDFIAQHFFAELVQQQGTTLNYYPECVTVRNLQADLGFPCREIARFEVDIAAMASMVGTQMLHRLQNFEDFRKQFYRPEKIVLNL